MKGTIAVAALLAVLTVGIVGAVAAPSPNSTATITFSLNTATCALTINSTKDISNYTVNGFKTDGVTTPSVTIAVSNGDVITVKSGTTTSQAYTVSGCTSHGGDDHHTGDVHHAGDAHHIGHDNHTGHDHHASSTT